MKYIITNWKAHKNVQEAVAWKNTFQSLLSKDQDLTNALQEDKLQIILCPPFPLLYSLSSLTDTKNIVLGAQTVAAVDQGQYTGAVTAHTLAGLVQYVLIGHSERRNMFKETEEDIKAEVQQAQQNNLTPLLCVRGTQDTVYDVPFIMYEPQGAIGTGHNEEISHVLEMKQSLHLSPNQAFLYGGSVNETNIHTYLTHNEIAGCVIGTASLDATQFYTLVKNVF